MQIHGLNKTTLLDYPGLVACTIFTGNCNFRCPFCQNSDLVLDPSSQPLISEEDVYSHLEKRKNIVKGVCITGGEPTLQKDLKEFIKKLRTYDVKIKLDTNGYRPEVIKELTDEGLLDYIAMDIKSSLSGYSKAAGIVIDTEKIKESIEIIENCGVDYEFRTTVVKELHDEKTFKDIAVLLKDAKRYFLQGYVDSDRVIEKGLSAYSYDELKGFLDILKENVQEVAIRGVE